MYINLCPGLAHWLWGLLLSSKCAGQTSQPREELILQLKSRGKFLPLQGSSSFLLRSSADWIRPTHTLESILLYSKSINVNINHISKDTFTIKHMVFDHTSGHQSPAKLIYKISHHTYQSRKKGFWPNRVIFWKFSKLFHYLKYFADSK